MSRALEVAIGVWNSQGGKEKHLFFFSVSLSLHSLVLVTYIFFFFFFKPGTDDYTTNNSV